MTLPADFDPAPYLEICREAADKLLAWRDDPSARAEVPGRPGKIGADIALHEYLCVRLDETNPGVPVISEEDVVHADARPSRYWLIDPIDGTASWKGGFPGFVVQIALIVDHVPQVGIMVAPALKRDYLGLAGRGAFRDGARLPRRAPTARRLVVDNYPQPKRAAARLVAGLAGATYLESGSLGLKAALVADGSADLFVKDVVVRDWDMAPAAVLLAETGCVLERVGGGAYRFDGPIEKLDGVVAARDGALAQAARAVLAAPSA
ncbi:MAG: inositol monophosphatase [Rhizobiales bacterium]|nr:inositol monophosphatase [Hyphomicrobiales bacterium]